MIIIPNKRNSPTSFIKSNENTQNNKDISKSNKFGKGYIKNSLKNTRIKTIKEKSYEKKPSDNSASQYRQKLISEFDKFLIQIGLQDSSHATFSDLKDVLIGMKMISDSDSEPEKWDGICNQVWKLLTADKHGVHRVSIRSVKTFVLGVCGINSQTLFEISEFESTPSASTQESRSTDEFVFTSAEHLSLVRSKFYEMILNKLTTTESKDQTN